MSTEDRSAGRWCARCQQHGSHHTDSHDEFVTADVPAPDPADVVDVDALREKLEKATPGPWERGDRWHVAGVMPGRYGQDRCAFCGREGLTLTWSGRRDINGTMMQAHVHQSPEPWHHQGIYSAADPSDPTCVVVETDEYGGCTDGDAALIVAAVNALPALLDEVERLRAAESRPDLDLTNAPTIDDIQAAGQHVTDAEADAFLAALRDQRTESRPERHKTATINAREIPDGVTIDVYSDGSIAVYDRKRRPHIARGVGQGGGE